ncbi:MAG: hypothetical protein ACO2O2_03415 [Acidilobaceae archaeon]
MDPAYLAILAFKLAVLTFYIGVLVYALPVPLPIVKRWGPQLLWDGVSSVLLASLYAVLYAVSHRVALMLGGSWSLFNIWHSTSLGVAVNLKVLLATLTAIPEVARLSGPVYAIASPLDRAATLAILFLTTLAGIADLIYNYGLILVALGAVLYAIPFRIARGAGAWLIAFIIVFSVGLQVLPLFVSSFASKPEVPESSIGYRLLSVRVESSKGNPMAYGVLVVMDGRGEVKASYMIDDRGYARSKHLNDNQILAPVLEAYLYVEFNGLMFPLIPRPLRVQELSHGEIVVARTVHATLTVNPLILVYSSRDFSVTSGDGWMHITSYLGVGDFIEIRYPDYCTLSVVSNQTMASGRWTWRGVSGVYLRLEAGSAGYHELVVYITSCDPLNLPSYEGVQDYAEKLMDALRFIDVNLLKAFILYYLTIPTIYVFMLFLATAALARVLGGRDRVPVRVA